MDIREYFEKRIKEINLALDKNLPKSKDMLSMAMRYNVLGAGKRLRPILVIAAAQMLGGKKEKAMLPACAIELVHNFTLIHDDLPCMDNDDYRRGRLTLHKAYNEAVAVLAGDALLNLAFAVLVKESGGANPSIRIKLIEEVSNALGVYGLVGGQAKEISLRGQELDLAVIEDIYMKKTAALISAAVRLGAIIGNANKKELSLLTSYGKHIGIAFQIMDDILEFMSGEAKRKEDELNYVLFMGLEEAKEAAGKNIELAKESLRYFGRRGEILLGIADYIITRDH
ncbi:MAG: polyprenyl synthetase family protein [Candidatus Omnitrophota bacterium]|nr:polyprenyl synthetase family protein [Candidatus Omnitrophota bacterium]